MILYTDTLPNGIRIVHHKTNGMVAHCGLVINTGSRNEKKEEHGIVHFIEHMLFKGTRKRKTYHILSSLDDSGGELNAYTTKEETAIHASVLIRDFEKAIDIISDITFNSVFQQKEIEKEKDVVIEEINSNLDSPAELIFDDFEELIFPGQAIGRNILGSPSTVKYFTQEALLEFLSENYNTDQMVFCSVGNIPDEKVMKLAVKYLGDKAPNMRKKRRIKAPVYNRQTITKKMDTNQVHCMIGCEAYNIHDKKRIGLFLLNNLLGGQGLNSRLILSLRERNGLAYNVESNYNAYLDTGVFSVYFGTDRQNLEKSISITLNELARLRNNRLGPLQFSKAKNQLKGYLARSYENHESLMLSLGKSILVFNRIDSPEETCNKIDMLTVSELLEISNEVFDPSLLSTLIYE